MTQHDEITASATPGDPRRALLTITSREGGRVRSSLDTLDHDTALLVARDMDEIIDAVTGLSSFTELDETTELIMRATDHGIQVELSDMGHVVTVVVSREQLRAVANDLRRLAG